MQMEGVRRVGLERTDVSLQVASLRQAHARSLHRAELAGLLGVGRRAAAAGKRP